MSQYTISGYGIAVKIRAKKTLLVEGKTYQKIVKRVAAADERCLDGSYVVDSADILKYSREEIKTKIGTRSKIGNRSKVLDVFSRLESNEKFAVLVDREWEGLRDHKGGWIKFQLPNTSDRKFVTSGHSIENYSFEAKFFSRAVLELCYESFDARHSIEIETCFSNCLFMALSISKVFSDANIISRTRGAFSLTDFEWRFQRDLKLRERSALRLELIRRKVPDTDGILRCVNLEYVKLLRTFCFKSAKMYLHGHIGEEVLRAAISAKMIALGVDEKAIREFLNESKDARALRLREYYSEPKFLPDSLTAVLSFLAV